MQQDAPVESESYKRTSRKLPLVRCSSFRWGDKRKGKAYRVSGWMVDWKENGKRCRRKFKDQREAKLFAGQKHAELLNAERSSRHVQTRLTNVQLDEAEAIVARIGNRYTLTEVGDFFFQNHQEANFQISLSAASAAFRGAQEGVIRDRTIMQLKSTLSQFEKFLDNCNLHEITTADVERFLRSLRARDQINPASKKSWNNYRGDLHLFFGWCLDKQRRWCASNPAADTPRFKIEVGHIEVLPLEQARSLMEYVSEFKGGKLARYFSLALFAGIRPAGELKKLAAHPNLIDLSNQVVRITPAISKTSKARQITIQENLYQWLTRFGGGLLPINHDRDLAHVRQKFELGPDVLRHTFISMHIAAFKSFADTALESGNSEAVIRSNYLNTSAFPEAKAFWEIVPGQVDRKIVHLA
jgi:integrase